MAEEEEGRHLHKSLLKGPFLLFSAMVAREKGLIDINSKTSFSKQRSLVKPHTSRYIFEEDMLLCSPPGPEENVGGHKQEGQRTLHN